MKPITDDTHGHHIDFLQYKDFNDMCQKLNLTPNQGRKLIIDAAIRRGLF